jgi:DNA-binding NtrC family response regulator
VRQRVLVVDDNPDVRRAYEAHLSSAGYEVHGASSLREGRARLASVAYDAVIVDVCLGRDGAEGLDLAAQVARQRDARPFLVLTAYGEPIFGRAAARLRADAFLHKPVSLAWLDALLRDGIAQRRFALTASAHAS